MSEGCASVTHMSNTPSNPNIPTLNRNELDDILIPHFDAVRKFVRKANNWHRAVRRYQQGEAEYPNPRTRMPSKTMKHRAYGGASAIFAYDPKYRAANFADLARLVGEPDHVTREVTA